MLKDYLGRGEMKDFAFRTLARLRYWDRDTQARAIELAKEWAKGKHFWHGEFKSVLEYQSFRPTPEYYAFVRRHAEHAQRRDWAELSQPELFLGLRWAGTATLLCVSGAVLWRAGAPRTESELRHELSIALLLALLLSPITWSHYALWLLIPLALLAAGDVPFPDQWATRALLIAGVLCILAPVGLVPPQAPMLREVWVNVYYKDKAFICGTPYTQLIRIPLVADEFSRYRKRMLGLTGDVSPIEE